MLKNICTHEVREELIDTLLAFSLLSQRIAQSLAQLNEPATQKGEAEDVQDERAGRCPYRIVRACQSHAGSCAVHP